MARRLIWTVVVLTSTCLLLTFVSRPAWAERAGSSSRGESTGQRLASDQGQAGEKGKGDRKSEEEPATTVLTVKVRSEGSGRKIPDARVSVSGSASASARTDDRGEATLSSLSQGRVAVRVSAKGWVGGVESITLDDDREEISIILAPLQTSLTVKIVGDKDGDQRPVDKCEVRVKPTNGAAIEKSAYGSGSVVIGGLPRGEVSIRVIAPGWDSKVQRETLSRDEQTVKVVLKRQRPPGDVDNDA